MANDDYVKFSDRVRVVKGLCDDAIHCVHVYTRASPAPNYRCMRILQDKDGADDHAEALREAIRLACEAVRERCACQAADYGDQDIADAIRGLDL